MAKKSSPAQAKKKPQPGVVDDTLKQRFKNQARSTTPLAGAGTGNESLNTTATANPAVEEADLELRGQQLRGDL